MVAEAVILSDDIHQIINVGMKTTSTTGKYVERARTLCHQKPGNSRDQIYAWLRQRNRRLNSFQTIRPILTEKRNFSFNSTCDNIAANLTSQGTQSKSIRYSKFLVEIKVQTVRPINGSTALYCCKIIDKLQENAFKHSNTFFGTKTYLSNSVFDTLFFKLSISK